jgi:putative flippase GtrA
MTVGKLGLGGRTRSQATQADNPTLQNVLARAPRPLRFVLVGGLGLVVDLSVFTLITLCGVHPLLARLGSLAVSTIVTWRLNRAFTFDRSGRDQGEEAARYVAVVLVAQATSYAIFAALVLSIASQLPQAAVMAGAAVGALVSYTGYRLFAFAPRQLRTALTPTPNTRS